MKEMLPEIISYALNILAYFLILLFRGKFSRTKTSMKILFEDKVKQVERARLETKEENEMLRSENIDYAKEVVRLRNALQEILNDEEVIDEENLE